MFSSSPRANFSSFEYLYFSFLLIFRFILISQQTFQRCFNVVFWLMRRRDVGQRQINIETTLCISTLKFTTSNNVESTLCISTVDMNNVGQRQNNVVIFNVEFYNFGKRRNNVVKMTASTKNKKKLIQIEYPEFKVLTTIS